MKALLHIFSVFLVFLALAWANGVFLGSLQVVAWTTMVYEAQKETSLVEAVEQTFRPEQKCELCKIVSRETVAMEELEFEWNQQVFLLMVIPSSKSLLANHSKYYLLEGATGDELAKIFCDRESPVPRIG